MKIENHIGYRFLTDLPMCERIVDRLCAKTKAHPLEKAATRSLIYPDKQKAYYITESVISNIDKLKVAQKNGKLDWSVFIGKIKDCKHTYLLYNNEVVRIYTYETKIAVCFFFKSSQIFDHYELDFFTITVDRLTNEYSDNLVKIAAASSVEADLMLSNLYKLLCFMFLSTNEEVVIPAGAKHGTKKSGKIINSLPFPITTVTSKWNITSIRTEGFPVSGHFRLQPTKEGHKVILIEPFQKHGYTRRAKNESAI